MKEKNLLLVDLAKSCGLQAIAARNQLHRPVLGGYVSDLLSDVMANGRKGDIWITLQTHPNIIAVAVLKEISAIVLINNRAPEPETIKKAEAERIPILTTAMSAFELCGRLCKLGVPGKR